MHVYNLCKNCSSLINLLLYLVAFVLYLNEIPLNDVLELWEHYKDKLSLSHEQIRKFVFICGWCDLLVFIAWIFAAIVAREDKLETHLMNIMRKWENSINSNKIERESLTTV